MAPSGSKHDDPLFLAIDLVRCPSVTPADEGALDVLQTALEKNGFKCHRLPFSSEEGGHVDNLYARFGASGPNVCFAGHTDVVPPGDETDWKYPPFGAEVVDGVLYGRGASDMKGAIAAFVAAAARYIRHNKETFEGSISLLITGDEEGQARNGTVKVLEWLKQKGETIDACLVGEPTNPKTLGEMVKRGRRGSLNVTVTALGKQGHAAYPERAQNPVPELTKILEALRTWKLDAGTEHFQPSNLEVTNLMAGTGAFNVIPGSASAKFNIRFNTLHTSETLMDQIRKIVAETGVKHTLDFEVIGEAFLTDIGKLAKSLEGAIIEVLGLQPEFSTTGGSSDARFIKDVCPVVEFGLTGETIHAVNECVRIEDIENLTRVYEKFLERAFHDA